MDGSIDKESCEIQHPFLVVYERMVDERREKEGGILLSKILQNHMKKAIEVERFAGFVTGVD